MVYNKACTAKSNRKIPKKKEEFLQEKPLFLFGVIIDIQYVNVDDKNFHLGMPQYY